MKTFNTKRILLILLAAVLLLIAVIFVQQKYVDYSRSSETEYTIDEDLTKELKSDLGNGTAGDVVNIDESKDEAGNRVYTLTYKNGKKQKVTIRKAKKGETGSGIESGGDTSGGKKTKPTPTPVEPGTVYERYCNLSAQEKEAFFYTFNSTSAFYSWYESAYQEYQKLHPDIIVNEDEIIDFGS